MRKTFGCTTAVGGIAPALRGGAMSVVLLAVLSMFAASAHALAPTDVWKVSGASLAMFSGDGSSVLLRTATGFQMRRSADGVLEKTITLPTGSRGYDAVAFSPNKQYVAVTYRANGFTKIELFSISTGALVRTINSGAVRNARGIDLSSTGLVAIFERWAYGGGGKIWVYRVSDGGFVVSQGPYTRNSSTNLEFSPDGVRLALNDSGAVGQEGVRVLRTTGWTSEMLVRSASIVSWANDNRSLWTLRASWDVAQPLLEDIEMPTGEVLTSIPIDTNQYFPRAVTPDNRFILSGTAAGNEVVFLRSSDGSVVRRLSTSANTWADGISPTGTLFGYTTCVETACTQHMARMPTL